MSTIVVVKKNGKAVIAADSLTTFGDLRMGVPYDACSDKIQEYSDGYFGIVGSAAHALVMESVLKDKKIKNNLPMLTDEAILRKHHKFLRESSSD